MAYGRYRRNRRKMQLPATGASRGYHRALNKTLRAYPRFIQTWRKSNHGPLSGMYNINGVANPFPKILKLRHSYSEIVNLTVGTTGLFGTERVFSMNDMYDPDFSSAGHQPYARDTLATMYNRYKVLGVWVECVYYGASTNTVACAVKISNPADNLSTLVGNLTQQISEQQGAQVKFLSNQGNQKQYFKFYMPMERVMGITKTQFKADVDKYSALTTASPSNLGYIRFAIADTALGSSATANCSIKLTYNCLWYQRKTLASS